MLLKNTEFLIYMLVLIEENENYRNSRIDKVSRQQAWKLNIESNKSIAKRGQMGAGVSSLPTKKASCVFRHNEGFFGK